MTVRVAILISGGGSNMVSLVDSMTNGHPARPVLVLSNIAEAKGLARAKDRGIETQVISHAGLAREDFDARVDQALRAAQADIVCLAGFMRILSPGFVAKWEGRMLNIHPSLLPKYKGLNTHARALAAGDKTHGCSVHLVSEDLDAGRVLGQATVPVLDGDTPDSLAARVLGMEHRLYPEVLRRFTAKDDSGVVLSFQDTSA